MAEDTQKKKKSLDSQVEEIIYDENGQFSSRLTEPQFCKNLDRMGLLSDAQELDRIRKNSDRMTHILMQIRKLAQLAADETSTDHRRMMLDQAAQDLASEYNQIAAETDFTQTAQLEAKLSKLNL